MVYFRYVVERKCRYRIFILGCWSFGKYAKNNSFEECSYKKNGITTFVTNIYIAFIIYKWVQTYTSNNKNKINQNLSTPVTAVMAVRVTSVNERFIDIDVSTEPCYIIYTMPMNIQLLKPY